MRPLTIAFALMAATLLTGCGSGSKSESSLQVKDAPPTTGTSIPPRTQPVSGWAFNAGGIGGLGPGQTVEQAEQASGQKIVFTDELKCGGAIDGIQDFIVFFNPEGKLVAVSAYGDSNLKTQEGIGLDSTMQDAKTAYPTAEESEASYGPKLVVVEPGSKNELVLEFGDQSEVTTIKAGAPGLNQQDEFCG